MAKEKTTETAMKTITVQGLSAEVSAPYVTGHTVTEAEAAALNQVRAENIRNNTAKFVKAAIKEADVEGAENLPEDVVMKLLEDITKYDAEYEFNMASVGGGRASSDPVEVEAKKIARQMINAQLKADGRTVKSVDKDKYDAAVAQVAAQEGIRERAAAAIKEREAAAKAALDGIDI